MYHWVTVLGARRPPIGWNRDLPNASCRSERAKSIKMRLFRFGLWCTLVFRLVVGLVFVILVSDVVVSAVWCCCCCSLQLLGVLYLVFFIFVGLYVLLYICFALCLTCFALFCFVFILLLGYLATKTYALAPIAFTYANISTYTIIHHIIFFKFPPTHQCSTSRSAPVTDTTTNVCLFLLLVWVWLVDWFALPWWFCSVLLFVRLLDWFSACLFVFACLFVCRLHRPCARTSDVLSITWLLCLFWFVLSYLVVLFYFGFRFAFCVRVRVILVVWGKSVCVCECMCGLYVLCMCVCHVTMYGLYVCMVYVYVWPLCVCAHVWPVCVCMYGLCVCMAFMYVCVACMYACVSVM